MSREGSPGADNQSTSEADSEAAAPPVSVPARQSSRSHSWRLSWMKPAKKVIAFEPDHLKAAKAVRKVLRTWKSYGLKDLKFDKEANTFRGRISAKNSFGLAALEFKGSFFAYQEPDTAQPGLVAAEHSLLVLKWKSGSSGSLNKVTDSLEKSLKEKEGLVITDEEKIKEMRRFCGC
ncbi:Serine/threonine-protein kinase brsk1 [Ascosphaera pollenicola]|nr:Serine/threonine-protein kinase brsk1 [Ascosphaera pollenicola]